MEKQEGWVETVLGHFCFLSTSLVLALGLWTATSLAEEVASQQACYPC